MEVEKMMIRLASLGYPRVEFFYLGGGGMGADVTVLGGTGEKFFAHRRTHAEGLEVILRAVEHTQELEWTKTKS